MHFAKVANLAALAGLSQAFLVPSTMSLPDKKVADAVPFEAQAAVNGAEFTLDCPGCPVVLSTNNVALHAPNKLQMKVAVQKQQGQEDSLLINDVPVLPIAPSATSKGMHANQLIQGPDNKWVVASNPELGYFLRITPFHDRRHKGVTVYNVHMRITEVGNELVRFASALEVKVIKNEEGNLMIVNTRTSSSHAPPEHEVVAVVSAPECNGVLCRWKITLFEKVRSFRKGCGRKGGPMRHPRPNGIFKGPHGRPRPSGFQHSRPHPHNRHGHGYHRRPVTVGSVINGLVRFIIIPLAFGTALGVVASILGAIVGHFVVFIWRALFRRGQRGQCNDHKDVTEDVEEIDEEKTGLMEDQEAPPIYEDAVVDVKHEQK